MLIFAKILYWVSLVVVFYTYLGYGILMAIWARIATKPGKTGAQPRELPSVTMLIPAYNEAEVLGTKIRNCLELNYPRHLLELVVITDGSDDGSPDIVRAFPQVRLIHTPDRLGKAAAINKAMEAISSPVVILTDANTLLNANAVRLLVAHYADHHVGAVSGEKQVMVRAGSGIEEQGEGLYWRYESFLKLNDARVGTLVGAAGELFSFRASLFEPLEPDTILDDFVLSLRICEKGYKVTYEPAAIALERGSPSIREEQARKVRIAAGGFQAMKRLPALWSFKRHPMLSFQYISHRVLRWTAAPVGMLLFLLANIYLVIIGNSAWYQLTLVTQLLFYALACLGWLGARNNTKWPIVFIPYYFVFMNWAVFLGWSRFLQDKQSGTWEKARRLGIPPDTEK